MVRIDTVKLETTYAVTQLCSAICQYLIENTDDCSAEFMDTLWQIGGAAIAVGERDLDVN